MDNLHLKEFSPDQKLFAFIQSDGVLKIWDAEKNALKQEYVPNLHLSAPCTALKWIKIALGKKVCSMRCELWLKTNCFDF
jgi:WD40 repeat protein